MQDKLKGLRFPTVLELSSPAAAIPQPRTTPAAGKYLQTATNPIIPKTDEWVDILGERYFGIIQDDNELNLGTPEVLWWRYLQEKVSAIIENKKRERKDNLHNDPIPTGCDFDKFIFDISKLFWQYYWRELAPDKIDNAFNIIEQFWFLWISDDEYKSMRAVRSKLRKKLGTAPSPGKIFSPTPRKKHKFYKKELAQGIWFTFTQYNIEMTDNQISEYIAILFKELSVSEGEEIKIAETVRSNYLSRNNPLKKFKS